MNNPYSPPQSDLNANEANTRLAQGTRMPGTVIAAIVFISVYLVLGLLNSISNPVTAVIQLALSVLILVGIVKGHALAWQWGVVLPTLMAIFAGISLLLSLGRAPLVTLFAALFLAVILAIPVLLTRRASRAYFALRCPNCKSWKVKAKDFFYVKRICRPCGTIFRRAG